MKYILMLILLWGSFAHASGKAITDEGEVVILHSNGTWEYEDNSINDSSSIEINDEKFIKDSKANFKVKSKKTNVVAWIDTNKWSFSKAYSNEEAEYQFRLKGEDLYGMMITERIEIPLENLSKIALENAKQAGSDIKITKREYRVVNGEKVIYMEMQGTIEGIDFTYLGYYFSNTEGSTQLVTFTATSLISKYRKEIDSFLNGLATEA